MVLTDELGKKSRFTRKLLLSGKIAPLKVSCLTVYTREKSKACELCYQFATVRAQVATFIIATVIVYLNSKILTVCQRVRCTNAHTYFCLRSILLLSPPLSLFLYYHHYHHHHALCASAPSNHSWLAPEHTTASAVGASCSPARCGGLTYTRMHQQKTSGP